VARELEYLDAALEEAIAAAGWYAERSATAAAAFSGEIDEAESSISQLPDAWRDSITEHAATCCGDFRSAWSIELKPHGS